MLFTGDGEAFNVRNTCDMLLPAPISISIWQEELSLRIDSDISNSILNCLSNPG
jgi:hypothetical protein